ncbi:hypothetical protein JW897_23915 [Chromobacterium alkanivorans]|uniref:hypothetical protein n=1 Tax=Chromobacterium alkanivorans TaxID=1071719 RepID=UPI00196749D7|nr:hypothetical protein [Chromobacterium alkanivorans]MBN3006789.1 hypothetical protein [Chromobacterium alkanivorans]
MTSPVQSHSRHTPSLSTLLFQLKSLRQQNVSLQPIDPLLQQLDAYCEHFHHNAHLLSLELGQVSSALSALTAMLDQSNLDTLECEQVYCLLEPFTHRLQQTTMQMQELA